MKKGVSQPSNYGFNLFPPLNVHPKQKEILEAPVEVKYEFFGTSHLDRTSDTKPIINPPNPTPMKEKEVCEELKAWWKRDGFYVIRNQQGIGSKKGLSDYTVIKDGKVLFVEAKATKGKQNPNQIAFQAGVEGAGGTYILAHSLTEFVEGWNKTWKP